MNNKTHFKEGNNAINVWCVTFLKNLQIQIFNWQQKKISTAPTQPKHIDRLLYKSKQVQTYGIHLHANLNNYKILFVN